MRLLILIVAVLLVAALVAHLAVSKPGYFLFSYGNVSVEMPLVDFVVLSLLTLGLLYVVIRAVLFVWRSPRGLKRLQGRLSLARARRSFLQGLIDMAEGRWGKAEKLLVKSARHSDAPVLNYLAAAQVAQRQRATDRRDEYLRLASVSDPKARMAVGLAQADLQMRQGQYEEAMATLRHLREVDPKHPQVAKLLARTFHRLKDWDQLAELLPKLESNSAVEPEELAKMRLDVLQAEIDKARERRALGDIQRVWKSLTKSEREDPRLIRRYALALNDMGESAQAESLLRATLSQRWDDDLALAYGALHFTNPHEALRLVDAWLREKPRSAELLCSAGRISAQAGLWGKALSLLRESLKLKPLAETFEALAQLHENLKETEEAEKVYKEGFRYLVGQLGR